MRYCCKTSRISAVTASIRRRDSAIARNSFFTRSFKRVRFLSSLGLRRGPGLLRSVSSIASILVRRSVSFLVASINFLSWRSSASGPRSSSGSFGAAAVGCEPALCVGIFGRLGGLLEHTAQIGFPCLYALAHSNHEIEGDRRAQHFLF